MKKFGLRKYVRDDRDWIWSVSKRFALPNIVDLSSRITRIEDQSDLGSCVAQAATSIVEYNDREPDNQYVNLSRLMLYADCRIEDGTPLDEDAGTFMRTSIKVLAKTGCCKEDLWPYEIDKYRIKPMDVCYEDAKERRIHSYYRIISSFDMRACLACGRPFILGIPIYESFMTGEVAVTGEVPMPGWFEQLLGYHAVYCAGYSNYDKEFVCVNSWGKGWGRAGLFYLPFKFMEKYVVPDGQGDCWMILR
jgi:C1A family cysteine protease